MTLDKFTIKAQEAVQAALEAAQRSQNQAIEPIHLLNGILLKGQDITQFLFQSMSVNAQQIKTLADSEMAHLPKVQGGEPYLTHTANEVLNKAMDEAQRMGDTYVSIEPMLLALLQVTSPAQRILLDAGITVEGCRKAVSELRKGQKVEAATSDENYQALAKYAQNLVEKARQGKLDPVVGRDEEIRRVLQIL